MKLKIEINMDNDAFVDDPKDQVNYVLKEMLRRMNFDPEFPHLLLRDINGNLVGVATITNE